MFVVHAEVHLLVVARCLGRLMVSGPPRFVGRFGRWVLQRTVAAFSTFSLVCMDVLVCHVVTVHFWVSLVSVLESSSQSLILAMMDSLLLPLFLRRTSTVVVCSEGIRWLDDG